MPDRKGDRLVERELQKVRGDRRSGAGRPDGTIHIPSPLPVDDRHQSPAVPETATTPGSPTPDVRRKAGCRYGIPGSGLRKLFPVQSGLPAAVRVSSAAGYLQSAPVFCFRKSLRSPQVFLQEGRSRNRFAPTAVVRHSSRTHWTGQLSGCIERWRAKACNVLMKAA